MTIGPKEFAERWRSGTVLKRDVFSTIERGRFRLDDHEVDAVLRRLDQLATERNLPQPLVDGLRTRHLARLNRAEALDKDEANEFVALHDEIEGLLSHRRPEVPAEQRTLIARLSQGAAGRALIARSKPAVAALGPSGLESAAAIAESLPRKAA